MSLNYRTDVKSISDKQHSYTGHFDCTKCHNQVNKTVKENHTYDKYGICTVCYYNKVSTITLKTGKQANVNGKTWIKVNVSKPGYLVFSSDDHLSWKFYNKSKKLYPNVHLHFGDKQKMYIPVMKGTYYINQDKGGYSSGATVKYVFKKDTSAKNYTKKKAILLKKGKKVEGVIYSQAKKNTWKRYYKIKLTKKQFLRLNGLNMSAACSLYDAKGKYVPLTMDLDNSGLSVGDVSGNRLNKGTYYLEIRNNWYTEKEKSYTTGYYYSFTLK